MELKLFENLEFWKLFGKNWSFENYLKIGVLKIKFGKNWSFENYLEIGDLKIGILKIIWKINLKIGVLKIKFWQLEFWKLNLKIRVLKIKFGKN